MEVVFPDYYEGFRCIAEKCRHNCCIGWEIDIDVETAEDYRMVDGSLGVRLKNEIVWDDTPHFRLGEGERCPFLNARNRCDLIEELGEDALCDICRLHPRFCNELPERIEWGLGLCCEEAGRIILGQREPMKLIVRGERTNTDEILALRDQVIATLQDRSIPLTTRIDHMREIVGYAPLSLDDNELADLLLSLERLDDSWTDTVCLLQEPMDDEAYKAFDRYREASCYEDENLIVYLIYRYFANGNSLDETALLASFAEFGFETVRRIASRLYRRSGAYTFEDHVELCRRFSSEIEYSEENRMAVLSRLNR